MCGAGFDGVKMCPRGFYCAIDSGRGSQFSRYGNCQQIHTSYKIDDTEVMGSFLYPHTYTRRLFNN